MFIMIKKLCIVLTSIMLINLALVGLTGSQSNAAPMHAAYLHAFYPADLTWQKETEKYIDSLDSISCAWSQVDCSDNVSINTTRNKNGDTHFYFPADYLAPVSYAKSKGKSVQLNIYSDMATVKKAFASDSNIKKLIDLIIEQATQDISQKEDSAGSSPSTTSGAITPDTAVPSTVASPSAVESPASTTTAPSSGTKPAAVQKTEAICFDGIVIDFEGLTDTIKGNPVIINGKSTSQCFDKFLQALKARLKAADKKLFVAVNPSDNFNGYDYKTIAATADRMILMAHDYEPVTKLTKSEVSKYYEYDVLVPTKSPAPSNDVKHAVNEIKAVLNSKELCRKVLLQVAFDSAQWQYSLGSAGQWDSLDPSTSSTGKKMTPTYVMIKDRIDNADGLAANITNGYNNLLECPYMTYYSPTEKLFSVIVYENSLSIESKIRHASDAGFGGVSVWALGNIPNYKDKSGIGLKLNVWDRILQLIESNSFWAVQNKPLGKAIKFTDKKLEKVIRTAIEKPTGSLYESDLNEINRLKLPANTTTQLADLKYLKKLEFLDASGNSISDLKPLSSLTNLKAIYLARNRIKDLKPLTRLTGLEVLSLNGNSITDVSPLASLVMLKRLYLSDNRISSVKPLTGLVHLNLLYLHNDPVKDTSPLKKLQCKTVY